MNKNNVYVVKVLFNQKKRKLFKTIKSFLMNKFQEETNLNYIFNKIKTKI